MTDSYILYLATVQYFQTTTEKETGQQTGETPLVQGGGTCNDKFCLQSSPSMTHPK